MSSGKSATVHFKGRLESLLQRTWPGLLGVRMHFHLVMGASEVGVFLQFLFHLLITEMILLFLDAYV